MTLRLPPLGFLLPLASALFAALWLDVEQSIPPSVLPVALQAEASGADPLSLPPPTNISNAFAVIADSPLLAESRKNPTPEQLEEPVNQVTQAIEDVPVEAHSPSLAVPPNILAIGLLSVSETPRVLLRNIDDGSETWAETGQDIQGWTLIEITQMGARLARGDAQVTVQLFQTSLP